MSAGTIAIRRRPRRFYPAFPIHYAASKDGVVAAETELARLVALHTAYARQPDISPFWQGYINQKAADVAAQRGVIQQLKKEQLLILTQRCNLGFRPPGVARYSPSVLRR
jgi:hypothetical protein